MPMSVSLARLNFYGIVLTLNGELGTKLRIMCESSPPDLLLARSRAAAIQLNYRWGNPIFANFFPPPRLLSSLRHRFVTSFRAFEAFQSLLRSSIFLTRSSSLKFNLVVISSLALMFIVDEKVWRI